MKRLNNSGFSLVELMVVVAIIGILAAVAIPNYQKFQRRARAAEGKTMLSAIYDGEKSAFASYEGYSTNFTIMGFKPDGNRLRTDAGFNAACGYGAGATCEPASMLPTGANAVAYTQATSAPNPTEANSYAIIQYCAALPAGSCSLDAGATQATAANLAAIAGPAVAIPVNNPAAGAYTFVAGSVTDCASSKWDSWTVDNNKNFVQHQDCSMAQ